MTTLTTFKKLARTGALLDSLALAGTVFAKGPTPVHNGNITEAEVLALQKAWGDALIQISSDFVSGGQAKAAATEPAPV